jgi:uncharacterized protein (TIGR02391 family)
MSAVSRFSEGALEQICRHLGEAVTGSQIPPLLAEVGITDRSAGSETKWRRLHANLAGQQRLHGSGAVVARLIQVVLDPVRFSGRADAFERHRVALNEVLALSGLTLYEDGKLREVAAATTLGEAQRRARNLQGTLRARGVHHDVLASCSAEILAENYFHTILEATKSLSEKIRVRTGLGSDGARLADDAFGLAGREMPALAFNRLESETERSEHTGLHTLIKGIFGAFRNPTAHAPRATWPLDESDALDLLQIISLLHRRLDRAHLTPAAPIRSSVQASLRESAQ